MANPTASPAARRELTLSTVMAFIRRTKSSVGMGAGLVPSLGTISAPFGSFTNAFYVETVVLSLYGSETALIFTTILTGSAQDRYDPYVLLASIALTAFLNPVQKTTHESEAEKVVASVDRLGQYLNSIQPDDGEDGIKTRIDTGWGIVGGFVAPGKSISIGKTPDNDEPVFFVCAASDPKANLSIRLERKGKAFSSGTVSEVKPGLARITYMAGKGEPFFVSVTNNSKSNIYISTLCTRGGKAGAPFTFQQVKDAVSQCEATVTFQAGTLGNRSANGLAGFHMVGRFVKGTAFAYGPYNIKQGAWLIAGSDEKSKNFSLEMLGKDSTLLQSATAKNEPFCEMKSQFTVDGAKLRINNKGANSFVVYWVFDNK